MRSFDDRDFDYYETPRKPKRRRRRRRRRLGRILAVVALLAIAVVVGVKFWLQPPEIDNSGIGYKNNAGISESGGTAGGNDFNNPDATMALEELSVSGDQRNKQAVTFAVFGIDKEADLTDTLMVGRFDMKAQTLNVVSIPRDTMANVSWPSKRINTLFRNTGGFDSIEDDGGFLDSLKDVLGFTVDCWAAIDLEAFVRLVDAIGGVYYDVPIDMVYEDYVQGLDINISAGYQLLDGEQAMGVVRFRTGYVIPDIGRIGTQQEFLSAVADQLFQMKNIFNLNEMVKIFSENVVTDLSLANLGYLATEFLKLSSEDISFHTAPYTAPHNDYGKINESYYLTFDIPAWLELVNECINPYYRDVTISDVDILYWDEATLSAVSTQGSRYYMDSIA